MSSVTAQNDHAAVPADPGHTHGPTDMEYFRIFWVLFAITALEVSTYWWEDWFGDIGHKVAIPLLFIMMAIKFFLVAGYFMHLKFDAKLLSRTFYGAFAFSLILYLAALTSMNFWSDHGNAWFNNPTPSPPTTVLEAETAGG
ncbi:MAG: cytochrome C oxidase subunit IV family protein [Microthrixaceae bacterium]